MAVMTDDRPLLDDNGAPTGVSAHDGDDVDILDHKSPQGGQPQTKVRLKDVDGTPEGWVLSTAVDEGGTVVVPPLDKDEFAQECMRQADRFGVNGHFLIAVAQLRSQIVDGTVGDESGPYRYTQAEWDAFRTDGPMEVNFQAHDIRDWRSQCVVTALRVYRDQEAIKLMRNGQQPSAVELYLVWLVGARACTALLMNPVAKVDAVLGAVVPDELPKGAGTPAHIIDRYATFLKKGNSPASGQEAVDQIAAPLQSAVDDTRDLATKAGAAVLVDIQSPAGPDASPGSILMQRATGAQAAVVRGHLVERVQRALIAKGHLPVQDNTGKRNDDGQFGQRTEDALKAWQRANQVTANGVLTFEQWVKLTGEPSPEIYQRCAQLTASFEGTNFGGVNPQDTDNTVVTFGYHGYTITGGNLQKFLKEVDEKIPGVLDTAFGVAMAGQLRTLFPPVPLAEAVQRAKAIFLSGIDIKQEWRDAFKGFGERDEIKKAQLDFSKETYWVDGEKMRSALQLVEPLSYALCFDVAIQNGPKLQIAQQTAQHFTAAMVEREKRQLFGEAVVQASNQQFQADVRSRKVDTLVDGDGTVHDGRYRLVDWGFAAGDSSESDVSAGGAQAVSDNPDFTAFIAQNLPGVTSFRATDFLFKGANNAVNHLNTDPPRVLWPNIIKTIQVLVELKRRLGDPQITFNSIYRSPKYNASVGGAGGSQHMEFRATDIVVHNGAGPRDWARTLAAMRSEGVFKGGIGIYGSFVHVDTRGYNADWTG